LNTVISDDEEEDDDDLNSYMQHMNQLSRANNGQVGRMLDVSEFSRKRSYDDDDDDDDDINRVEAPYKRVRRYTIG